MCDGFHCILTNLCTIDLLLLMPTGAHRHFSADPAAFEGALLSRGTVPTMLQEAMQVCTLLFLARAFLGQQNKRHIEP